MISIINTHFMTNFIIYTSTVLLKSQKSKINNICLKDIGLPVQKVQVLCSIAPPNIRREVVARGEKTKQELDLRHSLYGSKLTGSRFKSRKNCLKTTISLSQTSETRQYKLRLIRKGKGYEDRYDKKIKYQISIVSKNNLLSCSKNLHLKHENVSSVLPPDSFLETCKRQKLLIWFFILRENMGSFTIFVYMWFVQNYHTTLTVNTFACTDGACSVRECSHVHHVTIINSNWQSYTGAESVLAVNRKHYIKLHKYYFTTISRSSYNDTKLDVIK
ncbi:hypothetical protein AGLY_006407 [Aphis glycines]|uniref:Uncharacterized protein n=1 Tax=Aphis glycines TaxID=307491 RepID=A0A6G0TR25_APHGL|nr:hypothetical protein AGLY_006407 [Aphis glycines]